MVAIYVINLLLDFHFFAASGAADAEAVGAAEASGAAETVAVGAAADAETAAEADSTASTFALSPWQPIITAQQTNNNNMFFILSYSPVCL